MQRVAMFLAVVPSLLGTPGLRARLALLTGTSVQSNYGTQSVAGGTANWHGVSGIARARLSPALAASLRAEWFRDREPAVVATGLPGGALDALRGSVGVDIVPRPGAVWRNEVGGLWNATAVFPDAGVGTPTRFSGVVVSSQAVSFQGPDGRGA